MPQHNPIKMLISLSLCWCLGIHDLAAGPDLNPASLPSITESAAESDYPYRQPDQPASDQILLAPGLQARYLTREAADRTDMIALWPAHTSATHLISCVEGKREKIGHNLDGSVKYNPSIQAIELASGRVSTLVRGMDRCDGIRATAWGSILATEEADTGFAFELIPRLDANTITVIDRGLPGRPATTSDNQHFIKRHRLPVMAWEGFTLTASGTVIAGDELRPQVISANSMGGSIYKFIPSKPYDSKQPIARLDQSPLVDGTSYALVAHCENSREHFSQDCDTGNGTWIEIDATRARQSADTKSATGFYRPEDLHTDPKFQAQGLRFCWSNTGNKNIKHYGEVICAIDSDVNSVKQNTKVMITRFIRGNHDMNQPDNLDFNPVTGDLYLLEDNPNGDIFACPRDSSGENKQSEACVKIASVIDSSAEPTGFIFNRDGTSAYISIQHSDDSDMQEIDDYRTDDILIISGFEHFTKK